MLAQAGRRLRGLVPAHDTVARWGGDEFAVLIESAASPQEIVDIAERLAGAIAAEPFQVAGRDVSITASVGVAFADPDLAEHLLRNADLAMARAKDAGGGRVEVFAAHMHADVIRRLELATDLRAAIEDGSLGIEYQPVVELSTSRVASVEALVRWSRGGENVEPREFLGDRRGFGADRAARRLGAESGLPSGCPVAGVRLAGRAVGQLLAAPGQRGRVRRDGADDDRRRGLQRSALTLEVTERVLIEIDGPVMDGLARLRQLGVRLAIDDFGTGYASLAYLRQLPVDIIKIDPSFVAGLGTDGTLAMLTRTIVQVGHDLGIEIVAEGIERPEQLELLRAMGCGLGQGYLVARPMAAHGIESLRRRRAVAGPVRRPSPGAAGTVAAAPGGGRSEARRPGAAASSRSPGYTRSLRRYTVNPRRLPTRRNSVPAPVVLVAEELSPAGIALLEASFEVRYTEGADRSKLLPALADVDAVIVRSATQIDAEAIAAGRRLRVVARAGVGLDNVDVDAATKAGVMVVNAPASNIVSAAEHAVALLLALARNVPQAHASLKDGQWKRSAYTGVELQDKVVGILGLGRIGALVAERLAAFDMTVIAYDPYAPPAISTQLGVRMVEPGRAAGRG